MEADIRPHKRLQVWQLSMALVTEIYRITRDFPKHELYGLVSQVRRAAVSIASNIAEGLARSSQKEKLKFLAICQGSLSELDTQLEIALRIGYLDANTHKELEEKVLTVQRLLSGLMRSIRDSSTS